MSEGSESISASPRTAPSTEAQREIWLATRVGADASLAFNESVTLRFAGPLDSAALVAALRTLVRRHEALRTTLSGDGLALRIADDAPLDVPLLDLTTTPPEARETIWRDTVTTALEEPFDLEKGPLVRAAIVRMAPDEHRVTLTTHHVVCDGWSMGLLVKEWAALYTAIVDGTAADLPPADDFSAYAIAESERAGSATQTAHENYWVQQYAGDVPVLDLPTDRVRPSLKTYRSQCEELLIEPALLDRLRGVAAREQTTLFAVLLAGFEVLLHRLSSQDDIVVGIPVAGQPAAGRDRLVGHCVNVLPLRARLDGSLPFRAVLANTTAALQQAFAHQQFTFGRLLERLHVRRDPSRSPLVSVLFAHDDTPRADTGFAGVRAELTSNARHYENFELFLRAVTSERGLRLECQHNTDLFGSATIARWLQAYRRLLEGVAENTAIEVAGVPLLPEADRVAIERWNESTADVPRVRVHELIEAQAQRTPASVAVQDGERSITYGELNARADAVAARLRAAGVGANALVGLCIDRSIDMVAGLLGVLKAGGGYVPLDPAYPAERLAFMVADSGMRVLLTSRAVAQAPALPDGEVLYIDDIAASGAPLPADGSDPETIAYVIYTSGSTGKPKGVLVPHRSVVNLLESVRRRPGMTASDVVLAVTTLSFDIAVSELLLPLSVGARIVMASRDVASDGPLLLQLVTGSGVTFIDATPSTWRLLIDAGWEGGAHITAICTGEAMPRDLAIDLVERAGSVWNGYGPTETTVWSTFYEVTRPVDRILIGTPVANTRCHILDERLQPVPIGVAGELYLAGAGVTHGYLNRPELTKERFVADPFGPPHTLMYRTGDIARYTHTGDIECLGRNDDQVKIRGFRIELGEIESALSRHPAVARAAVIAREDRPGDKRLVAYVVEREGYATGDAELRAHVGASLPAYMVPAAIVRLAAMPLTPSGKIDRRTLPAPSLAAVSTFVAPRTPTQAMVADLWRQALGVDRVSVHDDFFALGGHSLLASQVLARLRRDHGIVISFRKMFEAPTVARFAELIDAHPRIAAPAGPSIARAAEPGPAPLTAMQERMWLLEMMEPQQRVLHNLPAAWRLTGTLDEAALDRALAAIVARHATLRTRITVDDGVPMQEEVADATVTLQRVDLRERPPSERDAAMRAYFDRAIATPYDLSIAPLFRATLIRLDRDEHVLFILPHNLIWDGWSFEVFLRELSALYAAFTSGAAASPLADLPIAYGDFARWQREWLTSAESAQQRAWWRTQLGGELPVLDIPSDHPRPLEPTRAGSHVHASFSSDDVNTLLGIARDSGATLFTVLFAGFCLLLHRLTEQDDVIVGTPVRARTRPETEDLIGPFMNMLVLRSELDRRQTFVEFLARVRDMTLDSFSHQELPLEVVDVRAPILRAFFTYQDGRERPTAFGSLGLRQLAVMPNISDADLRLELLETNTGISATLTGSRDLFDPSTMQQLLGRFRTLMGEIARNPHENVSRLKLIPAEERALLNDFSGPVVPRETLAPVHQLIEQQAQRTPNAVAVVDGGIAVEYSELEHAANALAAELRARGVGDRSRVAVHLHRSAELIIAMLSVMKTGATWLALDPDDPRNRLATILQDADCDVVLTATDLRRHLPSTRAPMICVDEPRRGAQTSIPPIAVPEDAIACLLYVPDGSGRLRGTELPHRALSAVTSALVRELGIVSSDVALAIAPPSLDVSVIELLAPLTAGARVITAGRGVAEDAEQIGEMAEASAATFLIASTSTWRDMLATCAESWPLLRTVCVGALPEPEVVGALLARTAAAWIAQGFPEAGIWSTLQRIAGNEPTNMLGAPLPGARVRVLDRDQHDVPLGVVGELYVGFAGCSFGYNRETTPSDSFVVLADGELLYRTGERVRWRTDGILERVKRRDRDVHLYGYRVSLEELSNVLRRHPAISDAAVVAETQGSGRVRLVGYIVPRSGQVYTDTELRRDLKQTLPARVIPRAFIEMDALPRTPSGDLDLQHLGVRRVHDEFAPPDTPMETLLANLWQEALGVSRIGAHDNFFELGGYSLLCFQVLERIERETGQRLNPRLLLLDSLRQIAARLHAAGGESRGGDADSRLLNQFGKLLPGLAYWLVVPAFY